VRSSTRAVIAGSLGRVAVIEDDGRIAGALGCLDKAPAA
jgi:hypothetical protein